MKKFAIKSVVAAVGALSAFAATAAAVNLDAASPTSIKYANEMIISTSVDLRAGAAADQTATTAFGASFGTNAVAYVRIDLTGGTFAGTVDSTMFTVNDSAAAAAIVSVAQSTSSYVIFAVAPSANTENLVGTNTATIDTDIGTATGITVTGKTGVTLRYRLFETLTAAANPASNNTLKDTGAVSYAAFQNALTTTVTAGSHIADVAASPSYTAFTNSTGNLGKLSVALGSVAEADGSALTAAELLAATNKFTVNGDFTFIKNANGTYTGAALSRVFLRDNADCTAGANTIAAATTASATAIQFSAIAAATLVDDHWLCATPEGTTEINPGSYTADLDVVGQAAYSVTDLTGQAFSTITRNGVRMVAPLVQTPGTYVARLVLTNSGSSNRAFTVAVIDEDNGASTVLSGLPTTLTANKTTVLDLNNYLAITNAAGKRVSLVVTVNAPQSQIDGLYQLGNPTTGAFTNHILSYKN